jgi:hypothetical protein
MDTKTTLNSIYGSDDDNYATLETKETLLQLEQKKRKFLEEKEAAWRLKSRAI